MLMYDVVFVFIIEWLKFYLISVEYFNCFDIDFVLMLVV